MIFLISYQDFIGTQAKPEKLTVYWGWHKTLFGHCLVGVLEDNVLCHLSFGGAEDFHSLHAALGNAWSRDSVNFVQDQIKTSRVINALTEPTEANNLKLIVRGTEFQRKVWQALLHVPSGKTVTYQQLAAMAGNPKAARAVGSAMARNAIAFFIPCHRVVSTHGNAHRYRWGAALKKLLLQYEKFTL